jgi:hypothetical protein
MNLLFVTKPTFTEVSEETPQTYVGTWKSAGGFISHQLLADGRYVKQRGHRPAVSGRYNVEGDRIAYQSDEGRAYEGVFADGALRQADMLFYKVN